MFTNLGPSKERNKQNILLKMSTYAKPCKFNLRVYGLWINSNNELFVCEEFIQGQKVYKFPGGGLELGEGLRDGLLREWQEELGVVPERVAHFYTTDFYQQSFYNPQDQIISVYYRVWSQAAGSALAPEGEIQAWHWWPLRTLRPDMLTLPIDQAAARLLLESLA